MKLLGLDIGTTSICVNVIDSETGQVICTSNVPNTSFIHTDRAYEKIQDPARILSCATHAVEAMIEKHSPIDAIGISGQMHGILYLDAEGNAVSPLYIWQDGRGDQEYKDGKSYAEYMSEVTGCALATGFGTVTHFFNMKNSLIPEKAVKLSTIHDYVGMKLTGGKEPVTHPSDAASLGLYNLTEDKFDEATMEKLGIDPSFFPEVKKGFEIIGKTKHGIPVAVAIGDNQASFMGSVKDSESSILVNVGTGGQVSMVTDKPLYDRYIETRPWTDGKYLLVGPSLCGGRAYAILERFFRSVVQLTDAEVFTMYPIMDKLSEGYKTLTDKLEVSTLFCGERGNPSKRGSISNISADNFTPQHLVVGVLEGTVNELYEKYTYMSENIATPPSTLVGSGNGIRKSKVTRSMFADKFGMEVKVPAHKEEAAYGAALFAGVAAGVFKSLKEAQSIIKYEKED